MLGKVNLAEVNSGVNVAAWDVVDRDVVVAASDVVVAACNVVVTASDFVDDRLPEDVGDSGDATDHSQQGEGVNHAFAALQLTAVLPGITLPHRHRSVIYVQVFYYVQSDLPRLRKREEVRV